MGKLLVLAVFLCVFHLSHSASILPEQKPDSNYVSPASRSVLDFLSMIWVNMPCPGTQFFIPYGCYCGLSLPRDVPPMPVDPLDNACKVHDDCYDRAVKEHGCLPSTVLQLMENFNWKWKSLKVTCDEFANDQCNFAMCECDRVFTADLRWVFETYPCSTGPASCPLDQPPFETTTDSST